MNGGQIPRMFDPTYGWVDLGEIMLTVEGCVQDLASHYPYIYKVIAHKNIVYTDELGFGICTDGECIYIHPTFAAIILNNDDLGALAIEFLLIHESLHVLFDHCNERWDLEYPDHDKANRAQDYEINFVIEHLISEGPGQDSPFLGMTNKLGGLIDEKFGRRGMVWEEIYDNIPSVKRTSKKIETSDEWKKGFSDGFEAVLADLRSKNLVECYEIRRS